MLLWLPRLRLWSFLTHFVFKSDTNCTYGFLGSSCGGFLFKIDLKCSSCCIASSCSRFLFTSHSNSIKLLLWLRRLLWSLLLHFFFLTSIQVWSWMLLLLPRFLLRSFLTHFSFKSNAKCTSGCLVSACGRFLFTSHSNLFQNAPGCLASSLGRFFFTSYSNLIQNAPLTTLPPPVAVSYSVQSFNFYLN